MVVGAFALLLHVVVKWAGRDSNPRLTEFIRHPLYQLSYQPHMVVDPNGSQLHLVSPSGPMVSVPRTLTPPC